MSGQGKDIYPCCCVTSVPPPFPPCPLVPLPLLNDCCVPTCCVHLCCVHLSIYPSPSPCPPIYLPMPMPMPMPTCCVHLPIYPCPCPCPCPPVVVFLLLTLVVDPLCHYSFYCSSSSLCSARLLLLPLYHTSPPPLTHTPHTHAHACFVITPLVFSPPHPTPPICFVPHCCITPSLFFSPLAKGLVDHPFNRMDPCDMM